MLKPNPEMQRISRAFEEAIDAGQDVDEAGDVADKQSVGVDNYVYDDEGATHKNAALALLERANLKGSIVAGLRGKKPYVDIVRDNPAHALPIIYLAALKLYRKQQGLDVDEGGSQRALAAGGAGIDPHKALDQMIAAATVDSNASGRNPEVAALVEYATGVGAPSLSYLLADKASAIRGELEDKHLAIDNSVDVTALYATLEALGRLCQEELAQVNSVDAKASASGKKDHMALLGRSEGSAKGR